MYMILMVLLFARIFAYNCFHWHASRHAATRISFTYEVKVFDVDFSDIDEKPGDEWRVL